MQVDSRQQQNEHSHQDDHYLVMHGKTLKCVCELCTCGNELDNLGKHHCPRPRIKGNFSTSYADSYKNIKMTPAPLPTQNYKYEQRHYNPEALRTSYQDTYIPQKVNNFVDSPSRL